MPLRVTGGSVVTHDVGTDVAVGGSGTVVVASGTAVEVVVRPAGLATDTVVAGARTVVVVAPCGVVVVTARPSGPVGRGATDAAGGNATDVTGPDRRASAGAEDVSSLLAFEAFTCTVCPPPPHAEPTTRSAPRIAHAISPLRRPPAARLRGGVLDPRPPPSDIPASYALA